MAEDGFRFIRFMSSADTRPSYGLLEEDTVTQLSGPPWEASERTSDKFPVGRVRLQAPVEPSKIVCVGLNYRAHVDASQSADKPPDQPLIFLKPPSSIIGPGDDIFYPPASSRVDYEAELGVVIGRTARKVTIDSATEYIFGFTCANDVTARDLQKSDGQWSRAKGFDTFCPVGPWIVRELAWQDTLIEGIHNDEIRQSGRTSQMIFSVPYLISFVSSIMTLNPGDLLITGTPAGIAPMKPGDTVEVRIDGIGRLVNRVAG
ncbi:MAG: fumarylacetoacetate hydrolase family protein [Candidatus Zixiibacteriota bacterium]